MIDTRQNQILEGMEVGGPRWNRMKVVFFQSRTEALDGVTVLPRLSTQVIWHTE
jgi:hypothetical protein